MSAPKRSVNLCNMRSMYGLLRCRATVSTQNAGSMATAVWMIHSWPPLTRPVEMAWESSSCVMAVLLVARGWRGLFKVRVVLPGPPHAPVGDAADRTPLVGRTPRVAQWLVLMRLPCERGQRLPVAGVVFWLGDDRALRRSEGHRLI